MLLITSISNRFLSEININDLEWPWTANRGFSDFFAMFGCRRV